MTSRLSRLAHTVLFRVALAVTILFVAGAAALAVTQSRIEPVLTGSMDPTIPQYSLVLAVPVRANALRVGDVVVFQPPAGYLPAGGPPVMHRIVELRRQDGTLLMRTRGDANTATDPWTVDLDSSALYRVQASLPHAGLAVQFLHHTTRSTGGMLTWPGLLLLIGAAGYAARLRRRDTASTDADLPAAGALQQVSFELRAPLSSIVGYTELLAEHDLNPQQAKIVQTIARQAQRLAGLAEHLNLLDAQPDDCDDTASEPTCLLAILHEARDRIAPHLAIHGVDLAFTIEGDTGIILDARQTRQAITALLHDAVTASAPGQVLRVDARHTGEHIDVFITQPIDTAQPQTPTTASIATTAAHHILRAHHVEIATHHTDDSAVVNLRLPAAAVR
ncbi:hypothetical protein GCM10010399_17580 [Dactylosporangium fulvum]|uniref:Signal peptidase I n=1 Tax=Dactylosporangium fulvum TaxID=53359 RepID=A0ABY5VT84_9ACTN|nr:signal peptidase I [Dactylosporangium fulvum]UWP80412.1 signal peptidase I [Dactylosporangium fulvum]